jgi:O-antigen/teichoic acid export membrane protein
MGVVGVIYSSLLSKLLFSTVVSVYALSRTGLRMSSSVMKSLAGFSFPIMLGNIATFYMTSIDKYLLSKLAGLASVGVYALGYKFAMIITGLVAMPFLSAWDPMRYKILNEHNVREQYARVLRLYTVALTFSWLCLAMFSEDVLRIMSTKDFWSAADVATWMLMAYVFHCWTDYTNFGIMLSGKTFHITVASVIGGITTTVLCLLLIPRFGAVGAAIAAVTAFFTRFLYVCRTSQRLYPIPFDWLAIASAPAVAVTLYLLSRFAPEPMLLSIGVKGLIAIGFALALWRLPVITAEDRRTTRETLARFFATRAVPGKPAAKG